MNLLGQLFLLKSHGGDNVIKVLTVGHDASSLKKVESKMLSLKKDFKDLSFTSAQPGSIGSAVTKNINIIVYDAGELKPLMGVLIKEIRRIGFLGPIVLIGSIPPGMNVSDFKSIDGLHILEVPYVDMQLFGIIKNCIINANIEKRKYKRFDVRESAVLEAYSSDVTVNTLINNISQNGVCVEGDLSALKNGDLLKLRFNFDEIKKERVMSARVVWVRKNTDKKEEAGLEFVSQKDVYKYLLSHAIN